MRKIQFFVNKFGHGDCESQVLTLANSLVDLFKIEIICLENNREVNLHKNIKIIEVDKKNFFVNMINEMNLIKDINKVIDNFNANIIIINDEIYVKWIDKLAFTDKKIIYWVHNESIDIKEADKYKRFNYVVVSNNTNRKVLDGCLDNVIVIPKAVDLDKKKEIYDGSLKLVTILKLEINEDFDALIELMKLIIKKKPKILLNIIGDGDMRSEIASIIRENNLNKNIHLFGYYNKEELNEELIDSDIFVSISSKSVLELSVLEGMSVGLPVVVLSDSPTIKEIITDDIDGILIENNDINKMSDEIIKLLDDEQRRENLGNCAIEKSYGYNINVIKIEWIKLFN